MIGFGYMKKRKFKIIMYSIATVLTAGLCLHLSLSHFGHKPLYFLSTVTVKNISYCYDEKLYPVPDEDKAGLLKALSSVLVEDTVKYYDMDGLGNSYGSEPELTYKIELYVGGTVYTDSIHSTFDVNRIMYRRDDNTIDVYSTLCEYSLKYRKNFTSRPPGY